MSNDPVQEKIKESVKNALDLEVKEVNIRIKDYSNTKKDNVKKDNTKKDNVVQE